MGESPGRRAELDCQLLVRSGEGAANPSTPAENGAQALIFASSEVNDGPCGESGAQSALLEWKKGHQDVVRRGIGWPPSRNHA